MFTQKPRKLSPKSGKNPTDTPVESHSQTNPPTNPPTRAISHSVTHTNVTISASEENSDDDTRVEREQIINNNINNHNNNNPHALTNLSSRILVTKFSNNENDNENSKNEMTNDNDHDNDNIKNKKLAVLSSAIDELSENQLHEPIEPSVTATSQGVLFSNSYNDLARRSEHGFVTSYTDRNQRVAYLSKDIEIEKSEAAGVPIERGHQTMLSGSIIPPQDTQRVSEYFTQGREARGMSVITDDGRIDININNNTQRMSAVSVTDFRDLPLSNDAQDTLRSTSEMDETRANTILNQHLSNSNRQDNDLNDNDNDNDHDQPQSQIINGPHELKNNPSVTPAPGLGSNSINSSDGSGLPVNENEAHNLESMNLMTVGGDNPNNDTIVDIDQHVD